MIRRVMVGLALIASVSIMGAGAGGPARAGDVKQPPNLTGQWRLDPRRSDTMQRPEAGGAERGARGGRGGWGEGGGRGGRGAWGGRGGGGSGFGGRGGEGRMGPGRGGDQGPGEVGPRPVRLPDVMHVTQTESVVSFEDSTGVVLEEITTISVKEDTLAHAPGAQVLSGQWKDDKLEVERTGPRGGKVTQTITLEKDGKSLVIHTKMESSGDMPPREFKRVYQKVTDL
jgi:hypothetical protein